MGTGTSHATRKMSHTVYYHGAGKAFTGRIACAMAMLEDAGAAYTIEAPDAWTGSPIFAVPAVKTAGGAEASQTTTVMFALATELGAPYLPEGFPKQIKAMQLMCDAADLMTDSMKFGEKPERAEKWFKHIDSMLGHELIAGETATCACHLDHHVGALDSLSVSISQVPTSPCGRP